MKSILEELWHGNISPSEDAYPRTDESKLLRKYIANHYDELGAVLTPEQNELFEKLDECYAELSGIKERELFIYAFRLGAKITLEALVL